MDVICAYAIGKVFLSIDVQLIENFWLFVLLDIQIMENDNQHKNVISGMPTDGSVQHSSDSTPSDITRAALPVHRRRRARSFVDRADCDEDGPVPQILAEQCQLAGSPMARDVSTVHFISGNPSVELVKGILHIYKNRSVVLYTNSTLPPVQVDNDW